jgi:L-alanine-DL-glutamate epimerase-like enolase superfamily enzyme
MRGKVYYFGPWADPDDALQKYLDVKDDLQAGRQPRRGLGATPLAKLVNLWLEEHLRRPACSVEIALWDIRGQAAGMPIAVLLGGIVRSRIAVAACMGIQSYERAGEITAMYVEQFRRVRGASRRKGALRTRQWRSSKPLLEP